MSACTALQLIGHCCRQQQQRGHNGSTCRAMHAHHRHKLHVHVVYCTARPRLA